jgi:glycosyltransferase involved in cell wall biosynthesis
VRSQSFRPTAQCTGHDGAVAIRLGESRSEEASNGRRALWLKPSVELEVTSGDRTGVEECACALDGALPDSSPVGLVLDERLDGCDQGPHVAGRDDDPAGPDLATDAADVARHDGQPARHRLGDGDRKALDEARLHEDVGLPIALSERVRAERLEGDGVRNPELATASLVLRTELLVVADDRQRYGAPPPAELGECLQQDTVRLQRDHLADGEEPDRLPVPTLRWEIPRELDPVRNDPEPGRTYAVPLAQRVGLALRERDDEVGGAEDVLLQCAFQPARRARALNEQEAAVRREDERPQRCECKLIRADAEVVGVEDIGGELGRQALRDGQRIDFLAKGAKRAKQHSLRRARRVFAHGVAEDPTEQSNPHRVNATDVHHAATTMPAMNRNGLPTPILYVHHRPELGGSPQSLYYLLGTLDRSRFEPHVYCPAGPSAELFADAGASVHTGPVAGFTHIWASTYSGLRWLLLGRELRNLPGHVAELRRVLASTKFGLVHLNDSPLIPAALLARRAGIPVVWHLRSSLPDDGIRSRALRRIVSRLSAAAIAINSDVKESFQVPAAIVPNPVDLERFKPSDVSEAKSRIGLPTDRPLVSLFGYIYPLKGFRDFIESARLVRSSGIDAFFLIVGSDVRGAAFFGSIYGRVLRTLGLARDYESQARQLVHDLGLDDVVEFVPFTRNTAPLYQASDIVVAPSRGPELGRPVIEAAACGRAVIASGSLSGAGLLIPGETGYLVPRRSPNMLAVALEWLIRDEATRNRFAANARLHAEDTFNAEHAAERVMEIYDSVLAQR